LTSDLVISGVGMVTPLGGTADESWRALLSGEFITTHSPASFTAGPGSCRVTELAVRSAWQAITESRWRDLRDTAIVIGTSKGPVQRWLSAMSANPPTAAWDHAFGLADIASAVAGKLEVSDGPRITVSAACASGLHALIRAAMILRDGQARKAIVMAAESSLQEIFLASFARLGVLAPHQLGCRPLDRDRKGFLVSEAAGAVCLECKSPADAGDVLIGRYAIAGDAAHLTGGDPNGATMQRVLSDVCRLARPDLIHAHATGTRENDPIELAAIEGMLKQFDARAASPPIVYSHKAALGHSLGAAGLLSVVINFYAHRSGIVPGNIRTIHPLDAPAVLISPTPVHRPITTSLAMASGFGGAIGAVSLRSQTRHRAA
jgi:3-oxoacyl-[acyl-carrier-protein] synthase II